MTVNAMNLIVTILISMVTNNVCGVSDDKSSAVFVIDKTNSMGTVIKAVKSGANAIFDTVTYSDESPIENFILVTFGDPNVSDAMITTNHDKFKRELSSITLENGSDCPELSLTSIKKALDASLPGSYLYVFTDASAKDYDIFEEVKLIAQKKDCQIVFILTGECPNHTKKANSSATDDVYSKLAGTTSGLVFHLLKQDIAQILKFVEDSIRSRRVILHSGKYTPGVHKVPFESDARTKDMTIAISGSYPEATLIGPDGDIVDGDELVNLNKILILKVNETKLGVHTVELSSKESSYVVISARSDIRFRHGFSEALPASLNDTIFRPIPGVKNYLTIKLYGERVQLTSVKFLNPNYHKLSEMALKLLDEKEQLYTTSLIYPPKSTFRIAVKGIDTVTNTSITRYGTMILETERFINKNPTVKIEGDDKITIEYGGTINLKCNVNAYPEPRVYWRDKDSGKIMPATESIRAPPYSFTSILEVERMNKNTTYECFAFNRLGIGNTVVKVTVKPRNFFNILEKPSNIEVEYNEKAVLHCIVEAYPPAKLTWNFYPRKRTFSKRNNFRISPDGSTLTIKHVQPSDTGVYDCKAENENNKRNLRATITISGKVPKLDKTSSEARVKEGDDAHLTCGILEANPIPEIKWYWRPAFNPSAIFMEIEESRNKSSISLRNLNRFDTGIYKCRAQNIMGLDIHTMDLFVECPPIIKDDVKYIVARKGAEINITCIVQGVPTPDVVWLKDGAPLGSEIHIIKDHSLQIKADLHHTGYYTCTATNKRGSARRTVQVVVSTLEIDIPIISKYAVKRNKKLTLKCSAEGKPDPTLKWIYFSFDKTVEPKTLSSKGNELTLSEIKENQRGYYTCVASNIGGSINITYEVDVIFPPEIQSDLKSEYRAVEGDRILKIHCRATGNPKPLISWQRNGLPIAEGDTFLIDKEADMLIIKKVTKSDTEGDYYCEAKNKINGKTKLDTATFKVIVDRYPSAELIINTTTVLIEEGETVPVKCFIEHKYIDTIIWYKDRKKIYEGKLELKKAKLSDSGVYTCRVNHQDHSTKETANTNVIVGSKPRFVTEEKKAVELEFGLPGFLNCKVLGDPSPKVYWQHNGAYIAFSDMVYNFVMKIETIGAYYCNVINDFGSVSRTFDITLKGCILNTDNDSKTQPLMVTASSIWPAFKVVDGFTVIPEYHSIVFSCPNRFKPTFPTSDRMDVTARCHRRTKFNIDGRLLDYTDIQCDNEVKPRVSRKRKLCNGKDTEIIKSVFDVNHKTIEVFETCVDDHGNPIYTKHAMRSPAGYVPKDTSLWDDSKLDDLYNCHNQEKAFSTILKRGFLIRSDCCFARRYLVNPRDVFPGPPQRATFSRLNIVPHWNSCHGENWYELEEKVRKLSNSINTDLIIYTGTYGYVSVPNKYGRKKTLFLNQKTHQPISKYLWKVVQYPANGSSLAIIQLNTPLIPPSKVTDYILCRDICQDLPWMKGSNWHTMERGYTYCCEIKDFEIAFGFKGVFELYLSDVLNI